MNDFLSGKAPLNLTMRLGDHMMLIQLQLSAVAPAASSSSSTHRRPAVSQPASRPSSGSSEAAPAVQQPASASSGTTSASSCSASPGLSAMLSAPLRQTAPQPPATPSPLAGKPARADKVPPGSAGNSQTPGAACGTAGCVGCELCDTRPVLDTRALAEASRNLTQTLKQLSSEVLTSRSTNVIIHNCLKLFKIIKAPVVRSR